MPPPLVAQEAPRTLVETLPPDRERTAGARGERFDRAAILFGFVFLAGFVVIAMVLLSRRRSASR